MEKGCERMIRLIDNTNPVMAAHILRVQIPAYRVEARLMNFDGIPPLQDTLESIQASAETFLGYFDADDDLAGFLSFEQEQAGYTICRLVVHPDHFRKGIGKALLHHFMSEVGKLQKVAVSTGATNEPALNLYKAFGFQQVGVLEIAPGVHLALLESNPSEDSVFPSSQDAEKN